MKSDQFLALSANKPGINWTAVSVYVLVAIIKKHLNLEAPLYTLLQVFSLTLLEKIPLKAGFLEDINLPEDDMPHNQLNLFDS